MTLAGLPECFSLQNDFRFDRPSDELRDIKRGLIQGKAVHLSVVSAIDASLRTPDATELFVLFYKESFRELVQRAREHHNVDVLIREHTSILALGTPSLLIDEIHQTIDNDSELYLIPEKSSNAEIVGFFTTILLIPRYYE